MKTGLVLEGGACRGVFTSGVLDVMLEKGMTFDYCIGVSAGAGNAMNFKSRQPGRVFALTAGQHSPTYLGLSQIRASGKLLDLDLLYNKMSYDSSIPFDFSAYYSNPMECEYTLTCCETGQAAYLSERVYQKRLISIVKASSSMPGLCAPVKIDGSYYLDGGIADPLPVFRALSRGCDRVVLITTKPVTNLHPTNYSRLRPLFSKLYRDRFPALYQSLMTRIPRYFAQLDEICHLEQEGKILVIRPEHCEIRSLEKDKMKMQLYYEHGKEVVNHRWDELKEYLR